jgi:hypothetical protein
MVNQFILIICHTEMYGHCNHLSARNGRLPQCELPASIVFAGPCFAVFFYKVTRKAKSQKSTSEIWHSGLLLACVEVSEPASQP